MNDSTFKNVIQISDNTVSTNGKDYLFDIAISDTVKTPVIFVQAEIPLNLLNGIYPTFSKIIVIVPNWTYYKGVSSQKLPKGIKCAEPMASSIIYEFKRENGKFLKDSLIIMGGKGFPEMEFNNNLIENSDKKVYYSERYGSDCCPRDQQLDNKPTREEFIIFFEKENSVKIIDTYQEMRGKEGEIVYYYSLKGLSNKLKLKFILERSFYRIINRKTKDIEKIPRIYTPTTIISLNNRMEKK